MARIDINESTLGNSLTELLCADEIVPGDTPSYELCKIIYAYHTLGGKIAESPIAMAQSQDREISVPDSPGEMVRDEFVRVWKEMQTDEYIFNTATLARVYGIASLASKSPGISPSVPIEPKKIADLPITFSVFDPLNTAGSLVLNQDPNAIDFMKPTTISVSGEFYHRSRAVTIMHGRPIYILYTSSAFGFVGRSAYQRALFPLKSFVQTMITDDLITKKAGVFIAMLSVAGAIVDRIMQVSAGLKRLFVQQSTTGNVISIGKDEKIETLNMQNIDGAYGMARKNILENIAVSDDMPAQLLNSETFAEGFGEGSEDAKSVARYVDRVRLWMGPLYDFMTPIVQRKAWTPDFLKRVQTKYPDYQISFEKAYFQWANSFTAVWPSLLTEPDSEKVKTDDVKLKAIIATIEVFGPMMDPENKSTLLAWAQDNLNENKIMFQTPLSLDFEALAEYVPPQPATGDAGAEPKEPKPFAAQDSAGARQRRMMRKLTEGELADLVTMMEQSPLNLPKANGHINGSAHR